MKKMYLYIPLFIFTALFALDKLMLLPSLQKLSQSDATYLFYSYKPELLDELEKLYKENQNLPEAQRKKFLIIAGSSRLLYFDYQTFRRTYPDWEFFNFSVPVTSPAYYQYIMERILDRGIRPDYVVLETDPFQFNESSDAFRKSNVSYSFDFPFLISNFGDFTRDEAGYFIAKNLFASYKYHPSLETIQSRLNNPMDQKLLTFNMTDTFQRENRGCGRSLIPREDWYERDYARLAVTSQTTMRWLYGNYKLSERQFRFLDRTMEMLSSQKIRTFLVRPPVSRPMERLLATDEKLRGPFAAWEQKTENLSGKYGIPYEDLSRSERFYCNTFVDGSHMSLDCYTPFMTLLMREYWGM